MSWLMLVVVDGYYKFQEERNFWIVEKQEQEGLSKKIMFGAQRFLPLELKFYQNFPLYAENSRCRFYTVEF